MRCASSFTRLKPGNKWKKAEKCCENLQFLFLQNREWWMGERGKSKIDRQKRECNGPMFGFVNTQTAHIEVDKQESRTIHLLFLHFVSYILLELLSCGVFFFWSDYFSLRRSVTLHIQAKWSGCSSLWLQPVPFQLLMGSSTTLSEHRRAYGAMRF